MSSSSGVIYAIIVGAWAVYLVPMWLRREDELNRARETQRYAAAIKVLAHKDAFERRWARDAEAGADYAALPIAAGQGFVPTGTARSAAKKATASAKPKAGATASTGTSTVAKSQRQAVAATGAARTGAKSAVTASVAADRPATAAPAPAPARTSAAPVPAPARPQRPAITATLGGRTPSGSRVGLMARRRRVVAILFAAFTLGALISADLGARFVWVMVFPAALLSAYIVWLRRDERTQAANRDRRRAVAQESHAQREAKARARAKRQAGAAREARDNQQLAQALEERHELLNRLDAEAEAQAEAKAGATAHAADQRRQTQAAARRRSSAAARARAQAFTQDAQDLPRASNG